MVSRKNIKKFALISVYNKKNLKYLCTNLVKHNYSFISTSSTGKKIRDMGFKCKDISKLTKFKEKFDGRVKTLNPLIYSSLLYIRDNEIHKRQFISLNVPKIDIVVVNLYPFERYLKNYNNDKIIEKIDVGGPSLLRAASKNFKFVTPILDLKDYKGLINNLDINGGATDFTFRKRMACKTFKQISNYDKIIYKWMNEN
tara:strand:+ start:1671 stop:2267 length:597 start_codon:yes stop_codon:yes gene_type:complete